MPPQELRLPAIPPTLPPAIPPTDHLARRSLDTGIALLILIVLSGLLLLVAVLVSCTSHGPLFYKQKRVGRGGKLFEIWKFRTMRPGSDRSGPSVTSADDDRITPVGRFLRNWKLDELPQLWNVVRGDMGLVGPRPQVPRFVDCFDPSLRSIVLHVRPGITGPTALHFRHEESLLANKDDREGFYIEQILPVKLEMDVEYVQNRTLRSDLRILTQTAWMFSVAPVKRVLQAKGRRRHHAPSHGKPAAESAPEAAERSPEDALGTAH